MIRNLTRETVLAAAPYWALGPWSRMRGMLGRDFAGFDAMIFPRNGSVHMLFMHLPLDVLFLDGDGVVTGVFPELAPWALAGTRGARTTIELPVGAIARSRTQLGDRLDVGEQPRRSGVGKEPAKV